jgi:serine/threonine protein kinase
LEAAVFARLGAHPALTRMMGCTTDADGRSVMVTEFAPSGSLDNVLEETEAEGTSSAVLVRMAMQVCEGMRQLVEEGLIHRDLALRNVLVFRFHPTDPKAVRVKVTDYGLSREGRYYYGGDDDLPMRWMPPEALERRSWSEKSDVWAFGTLMWEMWSFGRIPFGLISSDSEVAARVIAGEQLPQPRGCPDVMYALMQRCWCMLPRERPTFQELWEELLEQYVSLMSPHLADVHRQGDGGEQASGSMCVVCWESAAIKAFVPCGHRCVCEKAVCSRLVRCPVCRTEVQSAIRVYLA